MAHKLRTDSKTKRKRYKYIDPTYDTISKELLHNRKVLGEFLSKLIPEFNNVNPKVLANWIRKDPNKPNRAFNLYHSISYFDDLDTIIPDGSEKSKDIKKTIFPDNIIQVNIPRNYRKKLGYHDGKYTDYIIFNLEMQRRNTHDLLYRAELGASIFSSATLKTQNAPKTKPYNQIRKIYSIWLCKENLFTLDNNVTDSIYINETLKSIQTKNMFIHNFRMAEYYSYTNKKTGAIQQQPFYNPYMHSRDIIFIEMQKIFTKSKFSSKIFVEINSLLKDMFDTMNEQNCLWQNLIQRTSTTYNTDTTEEMLMLMGTIGEVEIKNIKLMQENEKFRAVADEAIADKKQAWAVADEVLKNFTLYMLQQQEDINSIIAKTGLSAEQINRIKKELN